MDEKANQPQSQQDTQPQSEPIGTQTSVVMDSKKKSPKIILLIIIAVITLGFM